MEIRIEDIRTPPVPRVAADGRLSEASAPGPVDWKFICERERVRAEDAEARCEELRWREVRARQRASSLDAVGKSNRAKLKAAREEVREVRRTAKRAVALEREAARLGRLLAEAGVRSLRDRVAERDRQIEQRNQQLAEQEQQLAGLREENTLLRDEIRELKKLPKRPRMKPGGMASSKDEDTDNSASGSSGSGRSGEAGKGRRKGRGPRRRLPDRHRRDVKVCLDDVPEGAVHKGYVDHTVREIVFHAEEVTYRCEVWRIPDGSRHRAPGRLVRESEPAVLGIARRRIKRRFRGGRERNFPSTRLLGQWLDRFHDTELHRTHPAGEAVVRPDGPRHGLLREVNRRLVALGAGLAKA